MTSPEFAKTLEVEGVPIPPITTGGGHQISASVGNLESLAVGKAQIQNLPVVIADSFGAGESKWQKDRLAPIRK